METYQIMVNTLIGLIIIPGVTSFLKQLFGIVIPVVKFLLVLIISGLVAMLLAAIYEVGLTSNEAIIIGLNLAVAAIGGHVSLKTYKKRKKV